MDLSFQVDLRGVVDLLSHHLYSSPRVYLRELLQNAVDATTARRATEPAAAIEIRLEPLGLNESPMLRIHDTGIGLTEHEVHTLLATIGRSSKRDDLGFARHEFLGQFGIGLLSCFLVADEIHVVTRSATGGPTMVWRGYADGRYSLEKAEQERETPGTTVSLVPRPGMERWLQDESVRELAAHYGGLLPFDVLVANADGTSDLVTSPPPWVGRPADSTRTELLGDYCEKYFGFRPFDIIDLSVPEAGLTGCAFVLPFSANPAERGAHRVYLKRMLLTDRTPDLLPEWAFFARVVVDASELRPTASREALYEDELLESTRTALGEQLRLWLVRLSVTAPHRLQEFFDIHDLGVKALALHDDETLKLVERWMPFETTLGPMPLAEFRRTHPVIRYSRTVDNFRQIAAVATAQGIGVVNGGYVYATDLLERIGQTNSGIHVEPLEPGAVTTYLDTLDNHVELRMAAFLQTARAALDRLNCDAEIREFSPASLPALYLSDPNARHVQRLRETQETADPLWAGVLGALDDLDQSSRPQLILNYRSPLVRRIAGLTDPGLVTLVIESLYGQALLSGHHPLRAQDTAVLNRSFLEMIDRAVRGSDDD
ncbi:HSP90 family protein [Fodinicola feengrottensis]|uniref:HSP90 family protein n=1 Tax=Fodinicola feengrottensis TaxID=435914 RepID=A0ABN2J0G0_9ACTN|nr:HSP90 family protein [Fodinicola feengrottensis]